jgi:hypothetical protein
MMRDAAPFVGQPLDREMRQGFQRSL